MTTLMSIPAHYPSMEDASLARQASADSEAFAELISPARSERLSLPPGAYGP
jgi:hypothetical protein